MSEFRVGITPDLYEQVKGRAESIIEENLSPAAGVICERMPPAPDKTATPESLNRYDAILALGLRITAASLRAVDRLAVVARWGVGYDTIDVDALTARGVALAITPHAVRGPVAEAILTLIFALSKNLFEQDSITRQGRWRGELTRFGDTLRGKTLGSIGCGNIAREMFRLAGSLRFGRFLACDPHLDVTDAPPGVELVSLEEVLRSSDYVVVNTLLNPGTRGLIGEEQLRLMKKTAYFINTARGPIVQEQALVRALREGWIRGAGLDVFETEPPDPKNPLLELGNVILSPHGLAWTEEIVEENTREACDNILAVARGEVPHGLVNRPVAGHPEFLRKLARYGRRA